MSRRSDESSSDELERPVTGRVRDDGASSRARVDLRRRRRTSMYRRRGDSSAAAAAAATTGSLSDDDAATYTTPTSAASSSGRRRGKAKLKRRPAAAASSSSSAPGRSDAAELQRLARAMESGADFDDVDIQSLVKIMLRDLLSGRRNPEQEDLSIPGALFLPSHIHAVLTRGPGMHRGQRVARWMRNAKPSHIANRPARLTVKALGYGVATPLVKVMDYHFTHPFLATTVTWLLLLASQVYWNLAVKYSDPDEGNFEIDILNVKISVTMIFGLYLASWATGVLWRLICGPQKMNYKHYYRHFFNNIAVLVGRPYAAVAPDAVDEDDVSDDDDEVAVGLAADAAAAAGAASHSDARHYARVPRFDEERYARLSDFDEVESETSDDDSLGERRFEAMERGLPLAEGFLRPTAQDAIARILRDPMLGRETSRAIAIYTALLGYLLRDPQQALREHEHLSLSERWDLIAAFLSQLIAEFPYINVKVWLNMMPAPWTVDPARYRADPDNEDDQLYGPVAAVPEERVAAPAAQATLNRRDELLRELDQNARRAGIGHIMLNAARWGEAGAADGASAPPLSPAPILMPLPAPSAPPTDRGARRAWPDCYDVVELPLLSGKWDGDRPVPVNIVTGTEPPSFKSIELFSREQAWHQPHLVRWWNRVHLQGRRGAYDQASAMKSYMRYVQKDVTAFDCNCDPQYHTVAFHRGNMMAEILEFAARSRLRDHRMGWFEWLRRGDGRAVNLSKCLTGLSGATANPYMKAYLNGVDLRDEIKSRALALICILRAPYSRRTWDNWEDFYRHDPVATRAFCYMTTQDQVWMVMTLLSFNDAGILLAQSLLHDTANLKFDYNGGRIENSYAGRAYTASFLGFIKAYIAELDGRITHFQTLRSATGDAAEQRRYDGQILRFQRKLRRHLFHLMDPFNAHVETMMKTRPEVAGRILHILWHDPNPFSASSRAAAPAPAPAPDEKRARVMELFNFIQSPQQKMSVLLHFTKHIEDFDPATMAVVIEMLKSLLLERVRLSSLVYSSSTLLAFVEQLPAPAGVAAAAAPAPSGAAAAAGSGEDEPLLARGGQRAVDFQEKLQVIFRSFLGGGARAGGGASSSSAAVAAAAVDAAGEQCVIRMAVLLINALYNKISTMARLFNRSNPEITAKISAVFTAVERTLGRDFDWSQLNPQIRILPLPANNRSALTALVAQIAGDDDMSARSSASSAASV